MATASGEHSVSDLRPSLPSVLLVRPAVPWRRARRAPRNAAEVVVAPRARVLGSWGSWSCSAARSVDRVAGSALLRKRFRLMPVALIRSVTCILLIKDSNVNPETVYQKMDFPMKSRWRLLPNRC